MPSSELQGGSSLRSRSGLQFAGRDSALSEESLGLVRFEERMHFDVLLETPFPVDQSCGDQQHLLKFPSVCDCGDGLSFCGIGNDEAAPVLASVRLCDFFEFIGRIASISM